jgi:DMSO/TMAO reductase YedYZ molybdopterin-dependent catalytic subunit
MNKNHALYLFLIIIMVSSFVFVCDHGSVNGTPGGDKPLSQDIITSATPKGQKLRPAEKGPVRSALGQPKIDLTNFQLTITGAVDSGFSLNWQEIQALEAVYSDTIIMYCVEGWEVYGNWKGFLIEPLLQKAKLKTDATYVLFHSVDGYTTALPIDYLIKYRALLAYQVNGKPLPAQDGFPLRLVAFGKLGYKWAKWVNKLELINEAQKGYWEQRGYTDRADVSLSRRKHYEGEQVQPLIYAPESGTK